MKIIQLAFCFLLAMFLCGFGCSSSKPTPDPLAGWQKDYGKVDQSIVNDYQNYIQNLSPEEKGHAISIAQYFEDGAGQHAVEIMITLDHTNWEHVLIYGKDNKRIKTIKYVSGHSAS